MRRSSQRGGYCRRIITGVRAQMEMVVTTTSLFGDSLEGQAFESGSLLVACAAGARIELPRFGC
jgi:hypothetical protein